MNIKQVLEQLNNLPRKSDSEIYITSLQPLVQTLKKNHHLAIELWDTGNKPARELAVRIADPDRASEDLLERWVGDIDEWGLTDSFTGHLVKHTPFAVPKACEWAQSGAEYVRRAGFATIAQMAWAKNSVKDDVFIAFLSHIEDAASDDRLHVKKAVNWALRDIGKRNETLRKHAVQLAERLQSAPDKTARWVGSHRSKEFLI